MKLYYYCSSCQEENSFKTKATNRFDLQKERGNVINERCKHCGTVVKRRINRVHAKPNKWILIIGGILGISLTVIALVFTIAISFLMVVILIPAITSIPFIAWREQDKKANAFNKVMVKDG
jgi:Flp pilus assembly protein TadB